MSRPRVAIPSAPRSVSFAATPDSPSARSSPDTYARHYAEQAMPSTRVLIILIALAVTLLGPGAAQAVQARASLPDIEDEVMCTVCGTTLELSESPQADRERALIRGLIAKGEDKQQIKDALVAEYGPNVLALP